MALIPLRQKGAINNLSNSIKERSTEIFSSKGACAAIAVNVSGSISKSRLAAKRKPRIIRSASSLKRSAGFPTARNNLASKSAKPLNLSIIKPVSSSAKALTVKSRRFKSSSRERTNDTLLGLR